MSHVSASAEIVCCLTLFLLTTDVSLPSGDMLNLLTPIPTSIDEAAAAFIIELPPPSPDLDLLCRINLCEDACKAALCCYDNHLTCIANNEDECKLYSACEQLHIDDETDISSSNASTAPDNSTMIEEEIGNSTITNTTDIRHTLII